MMETATDNNKERVKPVKPVDHACRACEGQGLVETQVPVQWCGIENGTLVPKISISNCYNPCLVCSGTGRIAFC